MSTRLIGVCGLARSGKDTFAEIAEGDCDFLRMSFASSLKNAVECVVGFPITDENKHLPVDWLDGKSPRELLQTLGTEWGREMIHPDIWVRRSESQLRPFLERTQYGVVFTDVRFPNEAEMIKRNGGVVVYINRPGTPVMNHKSECLDFDKHADHIILNDGTLQEYQEKCRDLLERLV